MKKDISLFESILMEMIYTQVSIREMSKKYNIPKSTLHYKLNIVKNNVEEEIAIQYDRLMKKNKEEMHAKGGFKTKGIPRKKRGSEIENDKKS